jgi:beta-glucosidase
VKIGASSTNIKQSADFNLKKDLVVEKDHNILTPKVEIPEFEK